MLKADQIGTLVAASWLIFASYVVTYFLVWWLVTPLQTELFPSVTAYASFFYLPHGVRVLATAVMGVRAIPALFCGELCGNYLFWGISDPSILLAVSAVGGVITWIGFEALRLFGIHSYYLNSVEKMPPLATLMLAGLVVSILNGFVLTAILEHNIQIGEVTQVMAAYAVGDMTGLAVMVLFIKLTLGLFRDNSEA